MPKRTSARPNTSAGILACRRSAHGLEVLLIHRRTVLAKEDEGAWSIPKVNWIHGNIRRSGSPRIRERTRSGSFKSKRCRPWAKRGGKRVIAFSGETAFDPATLWSNTFEIEWPPKSGRRQSFPEVDRAAWFDLQTARSKILSGRVELIDRLADMLAS
jgi:predicted NUDIX family NTP pyrophosphohydrolase